MVRKYKTTTVKPAAPKLTPSKGKQNQSRNYEPKTYCGFTRNDFQITFG